MSQERKAVGKVFRALRKKSGLTQETVAFRSGLDRTYVSLIELGKNSPTIDTACVLFKTMQTSFSEFAAMLEIELARIKDEDSSV
jgi:transcriptional regulator with XRE-family HTH domain